MNTGFGVLNKEPALEKSARQRGMITNESLPFLRLLYYI
jgi:hypothetical protein